MSDVFVLVGLQQVRREATKQRHRCWFFTANRIARVSTAAVVAAPPKNGPAASASASASAVCESGPAHARHSRGTCAQGEADIGKWPSGPWTEVGVEDAPNAHESQSDRGHKHQVHIRVPDPGPRGPGSVWGHAGRCRVVQLRNEGQSVVLEVNGSQALVLGLHSQHAEQDTMGLIRLSLGGILVKDLELFNSLRLEMDGCVRAGNWLNLSQPWATELVGEPRTCFTHIRRGSFFPGTGLAVFNTSDFPTHQGTGRSITIEMEGHIGNWTGTVLAILNSQHKAILTIAAQNQTQKLEVTFGERTDSLSLAQNELLLNLSENVMQIALGNKVIAELRDDARDWLNIWDDGMLLAFGGVPDYSTNTSDSQYLHGCIWGIRIQDRELDLDHALYKHSSISSHSCPASPDLLESSALLTADR
ncbi:sex hormone-binding globulin isoform X1 [Brienomyrus brachyistius]|uniref:sex hormone-binding globulin isoform X1 n=1 Tax=Brienomyrus brachyistius TaxID=42636 RepID=UPI0020B1B5DF|nr:sex hormone-binding globulin isoform X1 [Brienomyrus brachyistius]